MKKMRKKLLSLLTLLILVTIVLTAVPVHASSKVAEWHTTEFREMYAKIVKNEAWEKLDPDVRKQLENYARADKDQGERLLILRAIDFDDYVKKQSEKEDTVIGKFLDLILADEVQTYILLKEMAMCDGIEAKRNEKGIYQIYKVDLS